MINSVLNITHQTLKCNFCVLIEVPSLVLNYDYYFIFCFGTVIRKYRYLRRDTEVQGFFTR